VSRYQTYLLIIPLLLTLTGCAKLQKATSSFLPERPTIVQADLNETRIQTDTYLMLAIDATGRHDFKTASKYFEILFDKTGKRSYIAEAVKNEIMLRNFPRIKKLLDKGLAKFPDDMELNRYLAAYYIDVKAYKKAYHIAMKLLSKKRDERNLEIAGMSARALGNTKSALKYFKEAYKKSRSARTALHLADLLYTDLGREEEAIRLLETHSRMEGCSEAICFRLVQIYSQKEEIEPLIDLYQRLYKATQRARFAQKVIELYLYQNRFDKAIRYVKKERLGDDLLLDLYTQRKMYKKAYKLAMRLYKERGASHYLARAAVLQYESAKRKKDPRLLKSVMGKFEKALRDLDDPLFENYYGYLLIDHDIDIEKGIKWVQKALRQEPDSLFYLDSLAWGYYKLGKCETAYKIMKPLMDRTDEPEIIEHFEKIKACREKKE